MLTTKFMTAASCLALMVAGGAGAEPLLKLNDKGYFEAPGLNVTVFADIYPDGHQTGVTVIQHGVRVAANGDLRLEPSPGQWSPMPAGDGAPVVDAATHTVTQTLHFPDATKNRTGFNPIDYPHLDFTYHVRVTPLEGDRFKVSVDLDKPLPAEWQGKVGFNFELFPGDLFGKTWLMDDPSEAEKSGLFPRQADGPVSDDHGQTIAAAMAEGQTLTVAPDSDLQRMTIQSQTGKLKLIDGRGNLNNAWYIVREVTRPGATTDAITWIVTPNVDPNWRYTPVIQVSQVGYLPGQAKTVLIEQDKRDTQADPLILYKLTPDGKKEVTRFTPKPWGQFLRYNYLAADLSSVHDEGMYEIGYRNQISHPFKISADVYDRYVWQPTLEYFLAVQMCHMRVEENYRVWHGLDHQDDARMAQIGDHFDGYEQGPDTLTKYKPGDHVPGLDSGGWHDAGDYDLRVESQMGTVWLLSKMVEEFGLNYDATTIDETQKLTQIHKPDGKNDAVQQIEHGLLSVLGGYNAMGRTYRGIQDANLTQYTLLGDVSTASDGLDYDPGLKPGDRTAMTSSRPDDRWVFTEDNPDRELDTAAQLATASRAIKTDNPAMSANVLAAALDLYSHAIGRARSLKSKVFALSELAQTTHDPALIKRLVALKPDIVAHIDQTGAWLASAMPLIKDKSFNTEVAAAVKTYQAKLADEATKTPYGVPYKPYIWGAGWDIQDFGVQQYFFRKAWPQYTTDALQMEALNFVLGVHPGQNTSSFASGVGAQSATTAYGGNRADWSYIPGGVISGTALIRPDLPELKVWPYFWQQSEYVMGGGETNYMFLALAASHAAKAP